MHDNHDRDRQAHGGDVIRVLFVSDSHIGFDTPAREGHASRGDDFLRNHRVALARALEGDVDLVVHGGDLLQRSRVPVELANAALEPLREVAEAGVPVFLVPGNHERSRMPYPLLAQHPNLHVFERARTHTLDVRGQCVAVGGFPWTRDLGAPGAFRRRLEETGVLAVREADVRLLCMHQAVEGARVGPRDGDYQFRAGRDVIAAGDIPAGLAAILSGHIHRQQTLTMSPYMTPLGSPVVYAGSIERTTAAERHDTKGYLMMTFAAAPHGGRIVSSVLHPLETRPMFRVEIDASQWSAPALQGRLEELLGGLDARSVVDLVVTGMVPDCAAVVSAERVHALHPETMRVHVHHPALVVNDDPDYRGHGERESGTERRRRRAARSRRARRSASGDRRQSS